MFLAPSSVLDAAREEDNFKHFKRQAGQFQGRVLTVFGISRFNYVYDNFPLWLEQKFFLNLKYFLTLYYKTRNGGHG